jgi:hypothetical protein
MTQTLPELHQIRVVAPREAENVPWRVLDGQEGVEYKVLLDADEMIAGLLRMAPGAQEAGHPHAEADYHLWVVSGSVRIAGQDMGPGCFVYCPPRTAHPSVAGPDGCLMHYTYRPHAPRRASIAKDDLAWGAV